MFDIQQYHSEAIFILSGDGLPKMGVRAVADSTAVNKTRQYVWGLLSRRLTLSIDRQRLILVILYLVFIVFRHCLKFTVENGGGTRWML
jgi:hypothetical protein